MIAKLINKLYRMVPAWQPTLIVAVAILVLTLAPDPLGEEHIELFKGADKVIHALMFAGLAGVIETDRLMSGHDDKSLALWTITAIAILAGGAIEIAQQTMGLGRTGDWYDLLADAIGALIGTGIFLLLRKDLRRNRA